VVDIAESAENELVGRRRFKLAPGIATNQTFGEFFVVNEPAPLEEIKILRRLRAGVEDFLGTANKLMWSRRV